VEWNQIKDISSDCEWIVKRYQNAKCYIVPDEIHSKITNNPKMPVMEYFAKNLGIRKATNDCLPMVNADVFLGNDTIKNIKHLNPNTIYGTHHVSIKWDGLSINETHQKNINLIVTAFSAVKNLGSVVGNFILTHKKTGLPRTGCGQRQLCTVCQAATTNSTRPPSLSLRQSPSEHTQALGWSAFLKPWAPPFGPVHGSR